MEHNRWLGRCLERNTYAMIAGEFEGILIPGYVKNLHKLWLSRPWNTADGDIDCSLKIFVFHGDMWMTLKHVKVMEREWRFVDGSCVSRS